MAVSTHLDSNNDETQNMPQETLFNKFELITIEHHILNTTKTNIIENLPCLNKELSCRSVVISNPPSSGNVPQYETENRIPVSAIQNISRELKIDLSAANKDAMPTGNAAALHNTAMTKQMPEISPLSSSQAAEITEKRVAQI